jgi:hypothetical protein
VESDREAGDEGVKRTGYARGSDGIVGDEFWWGKDEGREGETVGGKKFATGEGWIGRAVIMARILEKLIVTGEGGVVTDEEEEELGMELSWKMTSREITILFLVVSQMR